MPATKTPTPPPIAVIYGDEEYRKAEVLVGLLNRLLPPEVDRAMALSEFDGSQSEEQGGPVLATVMDDLLTLPFLADRRVVVIREADKFITAHREKLERYAASPSPTGVLVMTCRSFPKTTRLSKAVAAVGGQLVECKKLTTRGLIDFVTAEAGNRGKRADYAVAARLVELIGQDQGLLAGEVEKLCLYIGSRQAVTIDDVSDLVGQTREEKIFAVMDAAAAGDLARALQLWNQVVATDPAAVYKALGGIAFKVRNWLTAHEMASQRVPLRSIAPKVMMWGRERELEALLHRLTPTRLKRILADIARLDSQAKTGSRSIETGVEALLIEAASSVA